MVPLEEGRKRQTCIEFALIKSGFIKEQLANKKTPKEICEVIDEKYRTDKMEECADLVKEVIYQSEKEKNLQKIQDNVKTVRFPIFPKFPISKTFFK